MYYNCDDKSDESKDLCCDEENNFLKYKFYGYTSFEKHPIC